MRKQQTAGHEAVCVAGCKSGREASGCIGSLRIAVLTSTSVFLPLLRDCKPQTTLFLKSYISCHVTQLV